MDLESRQVLRLLAAELAIFADKVSTAIGNLDRALGEELKGPGRPVSTGPVREIGRKRASSDVTEPVEAEAKVDEGNGAAETFEPEALKPKRGRPPSRAKAKVEPAADTAERASKPDKAPAKPRASRAARMAEHAPEPDDEDAEEDGEEEVAETRSAPAVHKGDGPAASAISADKNDALSKETHERRRTISPFDLFRQVQFEIARSKGETFKLVDKMREISQVWKVLNEPVKAKYKRIAEMSPAEQRTAVASLVEARADDPDEQNGDTGDNAESTAVWGMEAREAKTTETKKTETRSEAKKKKEAGAGETPKKRKKRSANKD